MPDTRQPAVTLRLATAADAPGVRAIYAPFVRDTVISFETVVPTVDEMAGRIAAATLWLVAEADGGILGYAYAGPHRSRAAYQWSVETSVYVADGARRQGLARTLYGALLDALVAMGYVNAFAGVTLPNAPSVGFHEAIGFRPAGVYPGVGFKDGAWHDVGWWSRRLVPDDASADPRPPRPLAEVADAVARRLRSGSACPT
jgi:phosphinothricin acetyltransferase